MPICKRYVLIPQILMNAHTNNSKTFRTMATILLACVWLAQSLMLQGSSFESAFVPSPATETAACCCCAEQGKPCCCQCQRQSCCGTATCCCSMKTSPSSGKCRCKEFPGECTCTVCLCGTDDLPEIPPALPASNTLRLHLLPAMQWTGEILTLVDVPSHRSFSAGSEALQFSTTASQTCVKLSRFRC